jgi:hypothetical protein
MSRKKKSDDAPENGAATNVVAVADPPVETPAPEPQQAPRDGPPGAEPAKPPTRPAASFAAYSDRTTRIEVALWSKQVKSGDDRPQPVSSRPTPAGTPSDRRTPSHSAISFPS